jgi:hypothetical protein
MFVNYFTNAVCKVLATITTLNLWQAQKECTELPFVVKKVHSETKKGR